MAKIKNTDNINTGEDVEQQKLSCIADGNMKYQSWFNSQFSFKTEHTLNHVIQQWCFLVFTIIENLRPHRTCIWVLITASFLIAKTQKESTCPAMVNG